MTRRALLIVVLQLILSSSPCFAQLTRPEKDLKGIARTSLDSPKPSKSQLARRVRSNTAVKALGLPVLETLPVTEEKTAVKPRSTAEIVKRCIAVEICAIKGESNDNVVTGKVIKHFAASSFLTGNEKGFVNKANPSKQELLNYAWQYERVHVLLWALGFVDKLKNPNEVCDVATEAKLIRANSVAELIAKAKPRSMNEVMNQADLYYRLHWAAIELRLNNKKSQNMDEEIVSERHYALNWLIHYLNQEWDEVTTDT